DRRIAELLAFSESQPASFWLAGAVLADGHSLSVEPWLAGLRARFRAGEWRYSLQTALAWKSGRQSAVRASIAFDVGEWTWVRWVRAQAWASEADIAPAHRDARGFGLRSTRAVVAALDPAAAWTADAVALSRIFHGSGPFWPAPRWELMLLRTWPSRRA